MTVQELIDALNDIPYEAEVHVEVSINGIGLMIYDEDNGKYFIDLGEDNE